MSELTGARVLVIGRATARSAAALARRLGGVDHVVTTANCSSDRSGTAC